MREWEIDAGQFAERFQLFVIIVLGESIVITGATAIGHGAARSSDVLALSLAFATSVSLWWLYFGRPRRRRCGGWRATSTGAGRPRRLHVPAHPDRRRDPARRGRRRAGHRPPHRRARRRRRPGDAGGPAIFLLGMAAFGARVGRHQGSVRLVVAMLLFAAVPLAAGASALCVAAAEAAILIALVVVDRPGIRNQSAR